MKRLSCFEEICPRMLEDADVTQYSLLNFACESEPSAASANLPAAVPMIEVSKSSSEEEKITEDRHSEAQI